MREIHYLSIFLLIFCLSGLTAKSSSPAADTVVVAINDSISLVYVPTECKQGNKTSMYIRLKKKPVFSEKQDIGLSWKMEFTSCNGELREQHFYASFSKENLDISSLKNKYEIPVHPKKIADLKEFEDNVFGCKKIPLKKIPSDTTSILKVDPNKTKITQLNYQIDQCQQEIEDLNKQLKSKEDHFLSECNKIIQAEKEVNKSEIEKKFDAFQIDLLNVWTKLNEKDKEIKSKEKQMIELLNSVDGELVLSYQSQKVRVYIVDLEKENIDLFIKDKNKVISNNTFSGIQSSKQLNPRDINMMTNAGMFTPSVLPEGFYKDRFGCSYPLDTDGYQENKNFYMQPNGVFYLDEKGLPMIETTGEFRTRFEDKGKDKNSTDYSTIQIGTQSGPMLVHEQNGKTVIKDGLQKGSTNKNIRSGVGLRKNRDSKVIFIISESNMNFYDFAAIFKDWFKCENALFLDGAISEMYTGKKDSAALNRAFGPMFCISKKKDNLNKPEKK